MSDPTIHPPAVRRAGFLVAAEGALGLIGAAVYVVRGLAGADQHIVNGYGKDLKLNPRQWQTMKCWNCCLAMA